MIAVATIGPAAASSASSSPVAESPFASDAELRSVLRELRVATGVACTTAESSRFLRSACSATDTCRASGPSAQDIECVRQATWKYRLETGADHVDAMELMPVLKKLGYV